MEESWFDLWLRRMRLQRVVDVLPKDPILVDIGCGHDAKLLLALKDRLKKGIGIDQKVDAAPAENIELKRLTFDNKLPVDDGIADVVTMLAVLEHVKYPEDVLKEACRILKPGGVLILTTPTPRSRPVLEFLSFKIGLVDPKEIIDHKRYLWGFEIYNMLLDAGFSKAEWYEFQFGMNTCAKGTK